MSLHFDALPRFVAASFTADQPVFLFCSHFVFRIAFPVFRIYVVFRYFSYHFATTLILHYISGGYQGQHDNRFAKGCIDFSVKQVRNRSI